MIERVQEWVELAVLAITVFASLVIVFGFLRAATRHVRVWRAEDRSAAFVEFRTSLSVDLLLGLEILVIADVIETITVEPDAHSLAVLAFLVVIRTAISWSTSLQIEGRWPWQPAKETSTDA